MFSCNNGALVYCAYRLVVVHFWAPWSQPCKQMNDVMAELAEEHPSVRFIKVEKM